MQAQGIQSGSKVSLHFRLALSDGYIVEDSFGGDPLEIEIGAGELEAGLESCLIGLVAGESATIALEAGQAFGSRDDEAIMQMERADFPAEMPIEKGKIIGFTSPSGEEVAGLILDIDDSGVTVDFNHPLAGRDIVFDVDIITVE